METTMTNTKSAPTMAWHPETGENRVFPHPSEVPEGWLDTHPSNASKAAEGGDKNPGDKLPMTRKEIVAALNDGGISFDKQAKTSALYAQLLDAVKSALTEAGVEFDVNADAKVLLE